MKQTMHPPAELEAWILAHLDGRSELSTKEVAHHWNEFREAFGIARGSRSSALDQHGSANLSYGRSGWRKWHALSKAGSDVVVLLGHYAVGWRGSFRVPESEDVAEDSLGGFHGDVVVLHAGLDWAFVISDHIGHALFQPTDLSGRIKGRLEEENERRR